MEKARKHHPEYINLKNTSSAGYILAIHKGKGKKGLNKNVFSLSKQKIRQKQGIRWLVVGEA